MKTLPCASALLCPAACVFAADPTPIEKSIASPERTDADRERDERDKPAEVMAFAGVKPGMTVADIFAGGGYYTELLAGVVGPHRQGAGRQQHPLCQLRQGRHQDALHRRAGSRTSSAASSKPAT